MNLLVREVDTLMLCEVVTRYCVCGVSEMYSLIIFTIKKCDQVIEKKLSCIKRKQNS